MKAFALATFLLACESPTCEGYVAIETMEACKKTCAPQPVAAVTAAECRCGEGKN